MELLISLPTELQAQVVSCISDLNLLLVLRGVSSYYLDLVTTFTYYLSRSEQRRRRRRLTVEIVKLFPNIRGIGSNYPVAVRSYEDLRYLANNKSLVEVTVDLASLHTPIDESIFSFGLYMKIWQGKPQHSYACVYGRRNLIRLTPTSFECYLDYTLGKDVDASELHKNKMIVIRTLFGFLDNFTNQVTYRGKVSWWLFDSLARFPEIKHLQIIPDYDFIESLANLDMISSIETITLYRGKLERYTKRVKRLIARLDEEFRCPSLTILGLPIDPADEKKLLSHFPNLIRERITYTKAG